MANKLTLLLLASLLLAPALAGAESLPKWPGMHHKQRIMTICEAARAENDKAGEVVCGWHMYWFGHEQVGDIIRFTRARNLLRDGRDPTEVYFAYYKPGLAGYKQ